MFWEQFKDNVVMTDLDGVLCPDGQPREVLYIPSFPIKAIVTGRPEIYKEFTEKWLNEHGVEYEELYIMLGQQQQEWEIIAKFKSEVYFKSDANVFIESCSKQANLIALLTKKSVYCVEDNIWR